MRTESNICQLSLIRLQFQNSMPKSSPKQAPLPINYNVIVILSPFAFYSDLPPPMNSGPFLPIQGRNNQCFEEEHLKQVHQTNKIDKKDHGNLREAPKRQKYRQHKQILKKIPERIIEKVFIQNVNLLSESMPLKEQDPVMDLDQFMELETSHLSNSTVDEFYEVLESKSDLKDFLEWIYARISQKILSDAFQAFLSIILMHKRDLIPGRDLETLLRLSTDLSYLKIIYQNPKMEMLRYEDYIPELSTNTLNNFESIANFMKLFALTVMLVLEDHDQNPLYGQFLVFEASAQKERKMSVRRSEKSIKIKKSSRNRH